MSFTKYLGFLCFLGLGSKSTPISSIFQACPASLLYIFTCNSCPSLILSGSCKYALNLLKKESSGAIPPKKKSPIKSSPITPPSLVSSKFLLFKTYVTLSVSTVNSTYSVVDDGNAPDISTHLYSLNTEASPNVYFLDFHVLR